MNGRLEFKISTDGCSGSNSAVNFLEHVEAVVTLSTSVRGEIELFLTSPRGTRSNLLSRRIRDVSADGFNEWPFMTTHSWGEPPQGVWKLEATNGASVGRRHLLILSCHHLNHLPSYVGFVFNSLRSIHFKQKNSNKIFDRRHHNTHFLHE